MAAVYHFHGDLPRLLRRRWRGCSTLVRPVDRSASIKDMLESLGLPHTEIGQLECDGRPVNFSFPVQDSRGFAVYPVPVPWDIGQPTLLRPAATGAVRFAVDVNVGRLARYLRMAGFDTLYDHRWHDAQILNRAVDEGRIILTRDLSLLMRKQIVFGRYIRAEHPGEQLREVLMLLALEKQMQPFSRCLDCNALLQPVAKEDILPRLEPLTRKYYHEFSICPGCGKVYWPGSHVDKMKGLFSKTCRQP